MAYNAFQNYSTVPTPTSESALGGTVGFSQIPPSEYAQVSALTPNADALATQSASDIGSELSGNVSTGTQNLLQDNAASFGVNAGLPWDVGGDSLSLDNFLGQIGLTSENLQNQGIGNYLNWLTGVGGTQTNPALAAQISQQNAVNAAAPNPGAAAAYAQQVFNQQQTSGASQALAAGALGRLGTGGGGTTGGGAPSPSAYSLNPSAYAPPSAADLSGNPEYGELQTGGNPTSVNDDELLSYLYGGSSGGTPAALSPAGGSSATAENALTF